MRIGIDANWLIYEKAGIGRYSDNLIKAILEHDRKNDYVLFFNFFQKPRQRLRDIKNLIKNSKTPVEIEMSAFPVKIKQWLIGTKFPLNRLYKKPIDLFYAPFFAGIPQVGWKKQVVTIHDLAFIKFPDHRGKNISHYYLKRTKQAVKKSQKIIAVSQATKKDLINLLHVKSEKIKVIYESVDKIFHRQKIPKTFLKRYPYTKNDFILSVCTLEPRKNLSRLVKAYATLPYAVQKKFKLVLVGSKGWNIDELYKNILDLNLKDKIILPGFVSDEDLAYFYNAATIFVYPSLYEGFGLPVLEAMACGLPVITSNASSLPEVAGKAAILINPYKEEQIALAIRKVINSDNLQRTLRQKGLLQAKKFSWKKAAQETVDLFTKMA